MDSPNKQDKYSESKLEALLLEYIFQYEDRDSLENKVRKHLLRQEEMWKENNLEFPHGEWFRTTLKKIHSNIKTKNFKDHATENYGKKSDKIYERWSELDMKNFPDDFTINNLNHAGKMDEVVGKTSSDTRKILNKRFQLSEADKKEIRDEVFDTTSIGVIFQPKMVHQKSTGKKGPSQNITQAILRLPDTLKINKDQIFEDNNIEYRKVKIDTTAEETSTEAVIELDAADWPIILNFKKNEAATVAKLKEFWNEENILLSDDIYNAYVNYKLNVQMIVTIPAVLNTKNEIKIEIQIMYDPVEEIRIVGKNEKSYKYNAAREQYLGQVKGRFDWLWEVMEELPENNGE